MQFASLIQVGMAALISFIAVMMAVSSIMNAL